MAKHETKPKEASDVRVYNLHTAQWEAPKEKDKFAVEIHEAIRDGAAKLPSDRTQEELDELEPGTRSVSRPAVTTGRDAGPVSDGTATVPAAPTVTETPS